MGEVVILLELLLGALAVGLLVLKVVAPALRGELGEKRGSDENKNGSDGNV